MDVQSLARIDCAMKPGDLVTKPPYARCDNFLSKHCVDEVVRCKMRKNPTMCYLRNGDVGLVIAIHTNKSDVPNTHEALIIAHGTCGWEYVNELAVLPTC